MQMTVKFTDVYDGAEYPRTETIDVADPPEGCNTGVLDEWAADNLEPHSGDGRAHEESGYFAEIVACAQRPDLVGREFEWGI